MPFPRLLLKSDGTLRLIHPLFDGNHFKAGCLLWLLAPLRRIQTYSDAYFAAAPLILFLFLSPPLL